MAGTDTIVGTFGLMPEDMYLRKYEETNMFEDPDMMYEYNRSELKKTAPVHGFFESDQKRTNYDNVGRLALREFGKRSEAEPWLPDGTFLDFQFATKDPRSLMPGPDMRKHVEQQYARSGYYNFKNDEDNSIPEQGIHPEVYSRKIRESQNQLKERYNNFETGQIGWHNGSALPRKLGRDAHVLNTSISDEKAAELLETEQKNQNKTTYVSNNTPIGWRKTVDHRFKVAHYGQIRGSRKISDLDYYKNRGSTKWDHEVNYVEIEESPVSRPTASMIVDLAAKRRTEYASAMHVKMGKSKLCNQKKRKITKDDMTKISAKYIKASQSKTAHEKLDQLQSNQPGAQSRSADTLQRHSVIAPKIVEKLAMINQKMAPRERGDLRESIQKSAKQSGVNIVRENQKRLNAESLDVVGHKHSAQANFRRGDERKVHVYSRNAAAASGGNTMTLTEIQALKYKSKETDQRRRNTNQHEIANVNTTYQDTHVEEFQPHSIGTKGKMNSKHLASRLNVRDHSEQEIGDGFRRNRSKPLDY